MADVVAALTAIPGRGACTDAERRAALWLHDELRARGHEAWVETVWVRPQWAGSLCWHAVLGVAASLAATAVPALALVALALAVSYAAELLGFPLLARLFIRRATQVVVVEGDGWVVAGTDAPRGGVARRWLRLPLLWIVVAALLGVVVMGAVRASGSDGGWVGVVQLVPTVVLLGFAAAALDVALSGWTPGTEEAEEVAAAVDALEAGSAGLLLCGAHAPFALGLRAWRRSATTASGVDVTSSQVKRIA